MKYELAPLAGFTDAPFRKMCSEGGADLVYTEMVSAAGLAHGSSPTRHLMETMIGEGPIVCQLFGAKESDLAIACREVPAGRFVELNLNAGCPMTKVTREGAGAKLIESPEKIYRLLKAMKENTSLPVSLKTRLGPHPAHTNIFEIADAARLAGARRIIVHARYTSQMHGGEVHLDTLAQVVKRAGMPVVGNGSVIDLKTAKAMAATGVDAIMIGRAALSNPRIFAAIKAGESTAIAYEERKQYAARHLEYLLEFRRQLVEAFPKDHVPNEDAFASVKMHIHLFRYFSGCAGAAALRARLNSIRTLSEIREVVG